MGQTDSPEGGGYMKNRFFPGDQTIHKPFIGNAALDQAGSQSFQFLPEQPPGVVHHFHLMAPLQQSPHQVAPGKSGPPGDQAFIKIPHRKLSLKRPI